MEGLSPRDITAMFLALGTLLACARILGEVAKKLNQPSVLGEILAGILLGPTLLGALAPEVSGYLFPSSGPGAVLLEGLTTLAIALFLLVAGLEVDLSTVWRQGKAAVAVALAGMAFPFVLGFFVAFHFPPVLGAAPDVDRLGYALFMATAMSITALPIVAKILMDLNIYRSDLGVTIVAAAVLNDLLGWMVFAVVLGMVGADHGNGLPLWHTLWMTFAFTLIMLTVMPWLIHRILPWIQAYASWPGGVLSFALAFALFAAAFTEWLGIHAIFGSFLAGVALGHSRHLREKTRSVIEQFISFIFAPLFFASIGLQVDFVAHFNLTLTLTILVLAFSGKVLGSTMGARMGGMGWTEAWGAGFGMSAQGTMGIILGVLALQIGLIGQEVFVSIVIMALATSLVSGPMLQQILHLRKPRRFVDFLSGAGFVTDLQATGREEAIQELSAVLARQTEQDEGAIRRAVLERERIMATGIGEEVAVPHARTDLFPHPVIAMGFSRRGIDFDAPDGVPARIICLILTPVKDDGAQLEILADIAATFRPPSTRERALQSTSFTEFLALVKSER